MSFTSNAFLFLFFPSSIILFFFMHLIGKGKADNIVLVILSLLFYSWGSFQTLLPLIGSISVIYLLGNYIWIEKENSKKWVVISIVLLTAFLFFSKYLGFIISQLNLALEFKIQTMVIIAPLGVSFLVFELISYIVDIYRGEECPGSFVDFLLFVLFFPKLLSGPIVFWKDYHIQAHKRVITADKTASGINRIIIGYAKKVIIADSFGLLIDKIENQISIGVDRPTMYLLAFLYFFQIYYDFSGYSDIAIGISKVFGFDLKENFDYPYMSCSISEFWRSWHISLGSWFREYVYIPLGGNKKGNVYLHLLLVFILTGIWHGANWTFLIWGIWHGILIVIDRFCQHTQWYRKTPLLIKWFFTMVAVGLGWMVFMAPDINTAFGRISALFRHTSAEFITFSWNYYLSTKVIVLLCIASIGSVMRPVMNKLLSSELVKCNSIQLVIKIILIILFFISVLFMVNTTYSPFLYFQF